MYTKRIVATLLLVLFTVGILYAAEGFYTLDKRGNKVEPASCTDQSAWLTAGTFLAAGAEPSTPVNGVPGTDLSSVGFSELTKAQIFDIPPYWNTIMLRYSNMGDDGDADVIETYLMRGSLDKYMRIGVLTFTNGLMISHLGAGLFADTATIANENWVSPINILSKATNYYAIVEIDVRGFRKIGFLPTTLTHDSYIEITGF